MSATTTTSPTGSAARPRLVSGPLLRVFLAEFGGLMGFYLLLPVVPQYATAAGSGGVGAGLTTGALMLSTVLAELVTPWLVSRLGYRAVLAAGLVLLGAPALGLPASASMPAVLAVCLLRGVGLAVIFVVCAALGAVLVPAERRGEGLGLYGVVAGVPAVVAMPLGVWLAGRVGYSPVFVAGAAAALAGLAVVPGLPGRRTEAEREPELSVLAGLRMPALLRPSLLFAATAMAAGVVVTFLPAAVPQASGGDLAAVALLVHAAAATLSRWWAGRYGDRHGAAGLLVPGVLVAAAGVLALVLVANPVALMVGMVLFGAGFGVVQNASLALMFDRVSSSGYGAVSALWSVGYDGGLGLGATGFGVLAGQTGYPAGFAVTAAVILVALAATRTRSTARGSADPVAGWLLQVPAGQLGT